jgi:DNA-binding transcriptional LysR family regulator
LRAVEIRLLRAFVAVAEERHFGRAAQALHVAQPALSQQIRRLEAELGVPLFERTTRRVELTPAAGLLLDRARRILQAVDAAQADTRRAAAGEIGRLSIGFTGSATYALLPSVAKALRAGLPGVELELHGELLTPGQVERLLEGTLDLGVLRPPVYQRQLVVEVVRREPLILVLPAGHPLVARESIPVEELADEPFVSYPSHFRSVLHDAVETACAEHGFLPKVVLEVSETSTLVSFVAAGLGVSLVPASVSQMTVAGAVYRELSGSPPEVELAIAWRREDDDVVLARALEIVRASIA